MIIIKKSIVLLASFLVFSACNTGKTVENSSKEIDSTTMQRSKTNVQVETADDKIKLNDKIAPVVADYINNKFLNPNDKKAISESERTFSLHQSDLNNDGEKEIFVYLNSRYFCGTGGCTVLILSPKQELITKLTVTTPPIFIEPTIKNNWKILNIKSEGEWKELVYNNGSYPTNPTILNKASYDAPSGHADIAFKNEENLKLYTF